MHGLSPVRVRFARRLARGEIEVGRGRVARSAGARQRGGEPDPRGARGACVEHARREGLVEEARRLIEGERRAGLVGRGQRVRRGASSASPASRR